MGKAKKPSTIQYPAAPASAQKCLSTAEAAKLLFVSRTHMVKLIEQGKIRLHHVTGQHLFVLEADVLAYREKKLADAKSYFASQTED